MTMEIIKKAGGGIHKFTVKKSFRWGDFMAEVGQELEIGDPPASELVAVGRIAPADLPEVGTYIVVVNEIILPGTPEKYTAKRLDRVALRAEDALPLLIRMNVIPEDPNQWRFKNARLRHGPDRSAEKRAALDKKAFEDQLFKIGIHPSMTRK